MPRYYRKEWETEEDFHGFLGPHETDPCRGKCMLCNQSYTARKNVLLTHFRSNSHLDKLQKRRASDEERRARNNEENPVPAPLPQENGTFPESDEERRARNNEENQVPAPLPEQSEVLAQSNEDVLSEQVQRNEDHAEYDYVHQANSFVMDLLQNVDDSGLEENENEQQELRVQELLEEINQSSEFSDENSDESNNDLTLFECTVYKYNDDWNQDPNLSQWIRPVEGDITRAHCEFCNQSLRASKSLLNRHAITKKHRRALKLRNSAAGIVDDFELSDDEDEFDEETAYLEIQITALIVARYLAFLFVNYLVPFFKKIITDSNMIKKINLNNDKAAKITRDVLGPSQQERLIPILRETKFSILTDETTDLSRKQSLCIVVRYYDKVKKMVVSSLWDVIQVLEKAKDATADAEHISKCIKSSFINAGIPLENCMAFCSDTCNLMMGDINSVSTQLTAAMPGLTIVKCKCHIEQLCARDASKKLPDNCEKFVSNIYNYISRSSKRVIKYFYLQEFSDSPPLMVLKPIFTRWLSLYRCIHRILRRWEVLKRYFLLETADNRRNNATQGETNAADLHQYFCDDMMKNYLLFLHDMLEKFVLFNEMCQSEKVLLPIMHTKIRELYAFFLRKYINHEYFMTNSLYAIDPEDETNFKDLDDVDLGESVNNYVNEVNISEEERMIRMEFKQNCLQYLVESCSTMKQRFKPEEDQLILLSVLDPSHALTAHYHDMMPDLDVIFRAYPRAAPSSEEEMAQINHEWVQLMAMNIPNHIREEKNPVRFWSALNICIGRVSREHLFSNLATFALNILSIPHANAEPERIWSRLNLIRTWLRNSLHFQTLRSILLAVEYINDTGGIMDFEVIPEMYVRYAGLAKGKRKIATARQTLWNNNNTGITADYLQKCAEDERKYKKRKQR